MKTGDGTLTCYQRHSNDSFEKERYDIFTAWTGCIEAGVEKMILRQGSGFR
jgi:hypothetical protein